MGQRVLDTSVLIRQWNRRSGTRTQGWSESDAIEWGRELVKMYGTGAIVTPVKLEVVCGVKSEQELRLTDSFLSVFDVADAGRILAEDWREAERLARRVPRNRKPRQLGDCLVSAIAHRLRVEVISLDEGFPR